MIRFVAFSLLLSCAAWAQTQPLAFEAASVRPTGPNPTVPIPQLFLMRGGPGTPDPGQINYTNVPMRQLLIRAYGLKPYQVAGLPWMDKDNERFDIVAKVPADTTADQFNVMLQNLLAERFNMVVHHETRDLPGYELTVAKGGPKFKESPVATAAPSAPPAAGDSNERPRVKTQTDGYRKLAPGSSAMIMFGIPGGSRFSARQQPISTLTNVLESPLGKPVLDKTGLAGKYDFNLSFSRDERTSANFTGNPTAGPVDAVSDAPPDLFTAMQDQLGLKLEQKKIPMDVVVVDRAERVPKEN
jgi:uncharacterized protein (TIGR03435 family)